MARLLGLKQVPVFIEVGDAKVTTEFGPNQPDYPTPGKTGDHWGLDIVRCTDGESSSLATVCAIASGTVIAQRKWVKSYDDNGKKIYSPGEGNCVYILHDDGKTITRYYHFKYGSVPDYIKDNARVEKGDKLGYMGNTGYSYGAHLHFQVEKLDKVPTPEEITPSLKGTPTDPEPYLMGDIVINKDPEYCVKIGTFKFREDAEAVQRALGVLGTDSVVEEIA